VIGYYVHHRGAGHLHQAQAVAREVGLPVTGLSSLARPDAWTGPWVQLESDEGDPSPCDVTAGGLLHWVPLHDSGLRQRMASISAWIVEHQPTLVVSDVSVEVALLSRLHGVPVVSVVLPGRRADPAHRLGYGVSSALVAPWPPCATRMVSGLSDTDRERVECVGGLARFPVSRAVGSSGTRRVTALLGSGGGQPGPECWAAARAQTPGWHWTVLGRDAGTWTDAPFEELCRADVVVTHAGLNAVAEVAAARRPAVIIPAERPHDEQAATARVVQRGGWPALMEPTFPMTGWDERLERARHLDGERWASWTDGLAAVRFADLIRREHERARSRRVPA
jgi:hypothetical protein